MRDIATSGLVADFLFGFGALFAIINPYGLAFIFLDNTRIMARLFGEEGTSVVTKLSAFLLLCIGVQIILTGASEVARSILDSASPSVQ